MGPDYFHIYGGHIVSRVATFLRDHLAATRGSVGCTDTPTPIILAGYAQALGLFLGDLQYPTPIRVYNKSRYLALCSGSAPDTPWSLSRASMGPILNRIHRTPSVFK